jgi:RNA polymerase sigma factor (sigma-70 family)
MVNDTNISSLIPKLLQQDLFAQHELYKRYYGLFISMCMRYTNTQQDAEEILQDGFLKIFRNIEQFKNEGSFEGWMKRIIVHTALDYTRSKQAKKQLKVVYVKETVGENKNTMDSYTEAVNSLAETKWELEALTRMLNQLSEQQRNVFNLFVIEGFGHKEIADMLDISERSSQLYLQQARQKLSVMLVQYSQTNTNLKTS